MESMLCTVERVVINSKDFWDYCSILGTLIIGCATFVVAWRQYSISKQQKNIALYEERYNKIYKLLLDTISEIRKLTVNSKTYNAEKYALIASNCAKELDYARFLIKETDFEKLIKLYNKSIETLAKRYDEVSNKDWKETIPATIKAEEKLEKIKKELLDIIVPYLQIEKSHWYDKIFFKREDKNDE